MKSQRVRIAILGLLIFGSLGLAVSPPAQAQPLSPGAHRKAEVEAKKAFSSANYEKAKELYSELYAQTDDLVYLRNLARCFEELKQPGPAISNFRSYLLKKGKALSAQKREEIEGRIAELEKLQAGQMEEEKRRRDQAAEAELHSRQTAQAAEELQKRQAEEARMAAERQRREAEEAARIAQSSGAGATGPKGVASATPASGLDLHAAPAQPPATSPWRKVGTGLLIASAVVAVVGGALMYSTWSTHTSNKDGKCGDAANCASARESINAKKLWSKISFGVAAGAAAIGGAAILLAPSPSSTAGASASMTWTF